MAGTSEEAEAEAEAEAGFALPERQGRASGIIHQWCAAAH